MSTPIRMDNNGVRLLFILLILFLSATSHLQAGEIFLNEQFDTLESWEPLYFKDIENHSSYNTGTHENTSCLIATSSNSASALLLTKRFNVYDFSHITWRWKVSNIYKKGDITKKEGDDSPIRLYVMFQYDPETASFSKRIQYETIRVLYGKYPPHSSLNYIWANKKHSVPFIPNPYSSLAMMLPVASGSEKVGEWLEHTVNIVEDYQKAFSEDPPSIASIAVMSDSDNTGESAKAYVDFIRIYAK